MTTTILIVEDDTKLREQIALSLDVAGHEILESPTGTDALALIAERGRQIDLVMLDLGLPEIDGFRVIRRLKADPVLKTIPLLLCTGKSVPNLIEGMQAGGDDYLSKPFSGEELHRRVEVLLNIHRIVPGAQS